MTFGAPERLWLLALLPLLFVLFAVNERRARHKLDAIVASRLRETLAGSVSGIKRTLRFLILLAGLGCVIVALSKPQYGYTWERARRKGRDVIIAIDTSKSMLATDLAPNRLTRAKLAAQDLIQQLQGDRIGVIAFAGTAFLQAPLTIDYSAALLCVNELDTDIITRGGTNIAAVINTAAEAFGKGESDNRCLVLFTDGEELERSGVEAAEKNASLFRVFTVGVGSPEGSIIPLTDAKSGTTFVKDEEGQIVKSRLDENRLREIAQKTGGFYSRLQNGPSDMKRIVDQGFGRMREREIDARTSRRPIERYQWPLAVGIVLLGLSVLIGERRRRGGGPLRSAAAVALFLLLPFSASAMNSGVASFEKKDYQKAYDIFKKQLERDPGSDALAFNAGAAAYKLGDYERSMEAFSRALTSRDPSLREKAEYNLGNTLYQLGARQEGKEPKIKNWRNALQHFDEALKLEPKNEDAKSNRNLVQKLIEELEKEQPKQEPQQQEQEQKQEQDRQQSQQQRSEEEKSDQSKQEQQDKEQQKGESSTKQEQQKQEESAKNGTQEEERTKSGEESKQSQKQQQPQTGNESNQQQQQQQPQSAPQPTPGEEQKKLTGELKEQEQKAADAQAAAAEEVQAQNGEMTPKQAMTLLDSLKGDDERVPLVERKAFPPVLKDW
jgi:Ca-activated chloride channel family protein